jgi:hypothetical protein
VCFFFRHHTFEKRPRDDDPPPPYFALPASQPKGNNRKDFEPFLQLRLKSVHLRIVLKATHNSKEFHWQREKERSNHATSDDYYHYAMT